MADFTAGRSAVSLRPGAPGDAEACGRICYEAFAGISAAHNFPRDFPSVDAAVGFIAMLLNHPRFFSVVAELDGQVVGSNFLDERSAILGLGPITIAVDRQNHGVGRALMQAAIKRRAELRAPGLRLVQAAYHTRSLSLYTSLGFCTREPLACVQGEPIRGSGDGLTVRAARPEDLDDCNRVCSRVHGHDRSGELNEAIETGTAQIVDNGDRITGYTSGVAFFGHAVAESNRDLMALIGAAQEFAGPGFLVPMRNAELFRWCLSNDLRVVQAMTLMTAGLYNDPTGAYLPSVLF